MHVENNHNSHRNMIRPEIARASTALVESKRADPEGQSEATMQAMTNLLDALVRDPDALRLFIDAQRNGKKS